MEEPTKEPKTELYPILSRIDSPDDLKRLSQAETETLAEEIRTFLVDRVSQNGGHLASNLGVVELTLAIHRIFSTPKDHVVFDVGHQCYVHKLLTGRRDQFDTLRRGGGLSGFPKPSESEHDCFGAGHSSTSLSAALGFAESDRASGSDAYTVCVIGDGAYTGGMIHEALNNCSKSLRLIIIINENEMSISKNIGRFATSLSRLRSSHGYFRTKSATASVLGKIPLLGRPLVKLIRRVKIAVKNLLYGSNYFENLGLYYLGPIDGNDEAAVERLLSEARSTNQSCIIHLKTQKGRGYAPAEAYPDLFHGVSPNKGAAAKGNSFSAEMGQALSEMAERDPDICAITAAMADGTGLAYFAEHQPPHRFFDVGIAEPHAVTFAAGLAANGKRPVVAIYSTFLQRAYDNILHDVALQNLPVVFCIDRAGLNASDGATHHGIFDVAFLSQIPNMRIYTPITHAALRAALREALAADCPCAIRYPNGYESAALISAFYGEDKPTDVDVRPSFEGSPEALDAVIVTHGRITLEAMKAVELLAQRGVRAGILLLEQIKPYADVAKRISAFLPQKPCKILFLEEEIRAGGMGMMMIDALRDHPIAANKQLLSMGASGFVVQERDEPILKSAGLDAEAIAERILQ